MTFHLEQVLQTQKLFRFPGCIVFAKLNSYELRISTIPRCSKTSSQKISWRWFSRDEIIEAFSTIESVGRKFPFANYDAPIVCATHGREFDWWSKQSFVAEPSIVFLDVRWTIWEEIVATRIQRIYKATFHLQWSSCGCSLKSGAAVPWFGMPGGGTKYFVAFNEQAVSIADLAAKK